MTNTAKENSEKGNEVQRIIADKYGGTVVGEGYDIEFPDSIAEVKSFLSTYVQIRANGRKDYYPNYVKTNKEKHDAMKKRAEEKNKRAIYIFVEKPRNEDGTEVGKEEWIEACMTWDNVDRILKNPTLTRETINDCSKWRGWDCKRHYRVTRGNNFFK